MKKRISKSVFENKEQFQIAFESVATELVCASVYFELFKQLGRLFEEYKYGVSQASAFWNITYDLHLSATIIGLCRAYDTHEHSNNLSLVLSALYNAITDSDRTTFVEPMVLKRLDSAQLADDIQFVDRKNDPVKKLIAWRGNMFVHSNFAIVTKRKENQRLNPPRIDDFDLLLTRGMEIVNRYGGILYSKEFVTDLIGIDAYSFVFECIRNGLSVFDIERDQKLKDLGLNPDMFRLGGFGRT